MSKTTTKAAGASLAKIVRPDSPAPLLRHRLFQQLDSLTERSVVWIHAPPGSGKTTLVSSYLRESKLRHIWYRLDAGDADISAFFHYLGLAIRQSDPSAPVLPPLTPEFLPGIRTFALRYVEAIAGTQADPAILVLDDYEQLPHDAGLHALLQDLVADLPRDLSLIVLSRMEPLPGYARSLLYERLSLLGGCSLNLTLNEAVALARARKAGPQTERDLCRIEKLHEYTGGWFAGFRLLMDEGALPEVEEADDTHKYQLLFDFFTKEMFDRFTTDEQAALLRTAALPDMTLTQAIEVSGMRSAANLLTRMHELGFFVVQRGETEHVYEYHPLFRAYLLRRAASTLTEEEWTEARHCAAILLAQSGRFEAAVPLLAAAGDWQALKAMLLSQAPILISTGRNQTLTQLLLLMPEPVREKSPWLFYWLGISQIPFQPAGGRIELERAFSLFDEQDNDASGLYLTWAAIVESYLAEWRDFRPLDRWIEVLSELRLRHPVYPSPEVEHRVVAMSLPLMFRAINNPELSQTVARAFPLLEETGDAKSRQMLAANLLLPALWLGDFSLAARLAGMLETAGDRATPPFISILGSVYLSAYHWNVGCPKQCVSIVDEALTLADRTGMYAWNFLLHAHGIYGHLALGNLDRAEHHLERLKASMPFNTHLMGSHYHYLAARLCEERGDIAGAVQHGRLSLAMALESGSPFPQGVIHLELASVLNHSGLPEEAKAHLSEAQDLARTMRSATLEFLCLIGEAWAAFQYGEEDSGRAGLRKALGLSREQGGIGMVFNWGPTTAAEMYGRALQAGIEVGHVREMIRRTELSAPNTASMLENWPWPVKIYTLGQFLIVRDEVELPASGKAQQKPLEMLMALLSFRSREAPRDGLADLLWPEAEGDGAYNALTTTAYRLRQLLGHSEAVLAREGFYSLNPRLVWVDAWAFEAPFARPIVEGGDRSAARSSFELAMSLYRGTFLPHCEATWVKARRERLHLLFREHLLRLARQFEFEGEEQRAVDCCLHGIAVGDAAEAFYLYLIELYLRGNRVAEAREAYLSFARAADEPRPAALQALYPLLFPGN